MEADWNELNQVLLPSTGTHAPTSSPPCLAFDTSQELLWAGGEYGRVTSFYGIELQKYTSFRAHPASELSVKQLLVCDKGIVSLSARSIHFSSRRGLVQWHLTHESFKDLRCMSFTAKGDREILVAGVQDQMFKIDAEKGAITETLVATEKYTMMRKSGQHICAATNTGSVHVLKASTLEVLKTWKAHVGWISDMDAKADFLVTCGWSMRQPQVYVFDPMAQVFDLKSLMQLPPIPFPTGAAYVRMHPRMSTTSIIASQTGQLQVVDIMNPNSANLRQVNIYDSNCYLSSLEMSPTGEAIAMTDTNGMVRIWGSPSKVQYSEYGNATEFPDIPQPNPPMDWSADTPLSSIGVPYYRDTLLSAWPGHLTFEVGAPPPKIDPLILKALKTTPDGTSWAPNPKTRRRNQTTEYVRLAEKTNDSIMAPKFLSEKARSVPDGNGEQKSSETLEAMTSKLDTVTKKDVPFYYANVEIKYSKFGVDDFDFAYFNKTSFSGLETHITNSYANPLLQLYRFTPWLRNIALAHASTSCLYESCLLCEMGFLIDMLEKANGANCQATNFLKTFNSLSEAPQLNLLEDLSPTTPLTTMIQDLNRFLLGKIREDYKKIQPQMTFMDTALVTASSTNIRCMQCNKETVRADPTLCHSLIYPTKNVQRGQSRGPRPIFSQILKQSVERHVSDKGYCNQCRRYRDITIRKTIQNIPAVLILNANVLQSPEGKQLWATPNWLPQEIGIIVERGQFFCYEGEDLKLHLQRNVYPIVVYELIGVVADIASAENQKPHLVSLVNVSPSSREATTENDWHIFNDFLVAKVPREEALRFDPSWKLPSVIAYQIKSGRHVIDDTWKQTLDPSTLYRHWSANQETDPTKLRLLTPEKEKPQSGTPVAIDAEFVELQSEEIEIRADGTRETRRPSRLGLARVSVLRGQGADEGLPFMDDYIIMKEPVINYLTQYSGIHPGDLDPTTSPHQLVSLKVAYKKLWLLLNLGCVFVGHGLSKDFRIINIHVPKNQVVDTADLFFIKERLRKLKLSFLAWFILHEDIQTDHGHDSVEDARTALRLWRKYEEYQDAGVLEQMLRETYKKGAEVGYQPPGAKRDYKEKDALKGEIGPEDPKFLLGTQTPERSATSRAATPSGFGVTPMKGFGARNAFGSPLK